MSIENVKLFYQAMGKDKTLQEKANAISQMHIEQKLDEAQANLIYQKELVPLANEAGYDFTLAELKEYVKESEKPGMREVSEEELAAVAGGGDYCACVIGGGGNLEGKTCACVIGGGGGSKSSGHWCLCPVYGEGYYDWSDAPF
jgi:hypothetical protein